MKFYFNKLIIVAAFIICGALLLSGVVTAVNEDVSSSTSTALFCLGSALLLFSLLWNNRKFYYQRRLLLRRKRAGTLDLTVPPMLKKAVGKRVRVTTLGSMFVGKLVGCGEDYLKIVTTEQSRKVHVVRIGAIDSIEVFYQISESEMD